MEIKDVLDQLEYMRKMHKMTEEDLCQGLLSTRTYRRYIYLESSIPTHILETLLKRLDMEIYDFLFECEIASRVKHDDENTLVTHLFNDRFEEAMNILPKIDLNHIKSSRAKKLLPLYLPKLHAYQGLISSIDVKKIQLSALDMKKLSNASFMTQATLYLILDMIHDLPFDMLEDVITITSKVMQHEILIIPYHIYYQHIATRIHLIASIRLDQSKELEPLILEALKSTYTHESLTSVYEILDDIYEITQFKSMPYVSKIMNDFFIPSLLTHPSVTLKGLVGQLEIHQEHIMSKSLFLDQFDLKDRHVDIIGQTNTSKDMKLIDVLETYRMSNRINVSSFVEDVMSPYTYYRYLKSSHDITLESGLKLIDKTPYTEQDIFHYLKYIKQLESFDETYFMYAFINHHQERTYYYYQKIKNRFHDIHTLSYQRLYTYLTMKRYEYIQGIISYDDFIKILSNMTLPSLQKTLEKDMIYVIALYAMTYRYGIKHTVKPIQLLKLLTRESYVLEGPHLMMASEDILYRLDKKLFLNTHLTNYVLFLKKVLDKQKTYIGYNLHVYYVLCIYYSQQKDDHLSSHYSLKLLMTLKIIGLKDVYDLYITELQHTYQVDLIKHLHTHFQALQH